MAVRIAPAARPPTGRIRVPGDKSISHRALMLGALAVGETTIEGLLESDDVLATAAALEAMGVGIERGETWRVHGVGVGGLLQPRPALDLGNSGTSARLLMGLLATHPVTAVLTGDASLSRRPMARVSEPLARMGATIDASPGTTLPLRIAGAPVPVPIEHEPAVPSAQVKSAVLLAGLNARGRTSVIERAATRDHTERMLAAFGAPPAIEELPGGGRRIAVTGEADLAPAHVVVPGDPSSAAFFVVAALLIEGSDLVIENVGLNPTRAGLFEALRAMGGRIDDLDRREAGGEPVADLRVRHSRLEALEIDPALAPSMIDEFPILFVAAALAHGTTTTSGLAELRVKESDRLATMAAALRTVGARVEERGDGLVVEGTGGEPLPGGGPVAAHHDHRVAMSAAIAGLVSSDGTSLDDDAAIATSFPGFAELVERIAR